MLTTLNGLVLRERALGDNDKYLDILTDAEGLIEVLARGVKKSGAKNSSVSQPYCYAKYCLNQSNGRYFLTSAEPIRTFFEISRDMERFSLAAYLSELTIYVSTQEKPGNEVLRLILNCLHFLSLGTRDTSWIKTVFEFRLMSEIGMVPNLLGCCVCLKYNAPTMQFDLRDGKLYCESCVGNRKLENMEALDSTLLHYLRFIALTDMKQLFSLKILPEYMVNLENIAERYCRIQLGHTFKTLDFYKSLKNGQNYE